MELTQPIGFLGAGNVGCSMGKYLSEHGFPISGYYSRTKESALAAAQFTNSSCYSSLDELIEASDTLFIAVNDDMIHSVWDRIVETANPQQLHSKIICHFSGSLSSDVFFPLHGIEICPASVHPMLAFPDRFHSWKALSDAFFTIEGEETALSYFSQMFQTTGNSVSILSADKKPLYHTAASMISNHVIALLDIGLSLFMDCGFSKKDAYKACAPLIRGNIENVLSNDTLSALTGPIERGDIKTVKKHWKSLDKETAKLYCLLGKRQLALAAKKHTQTDFSTIKALFQAFEKELVETTETCEKYRKKQDYKE